VAVHRFPWCAWANHCLITGRGQAPFEGAARGAVTSGARVRAARAVSGRQGWRCERRGLLLLAKAVPPMTPLGNPQTLIVDGVPACPCASGAPLCCEKHGTPAFLGRWRGFLNVGLLNLDAAA
jgi:hypothetical protein